MALTYFAFINLLDARSCLNDHFVTNAMHNPYFSTGIKQHDLMSLISMFNEFMYNEFTDKIE